MSIVNEQMYGYGGGSVIRAIFEFGKKRKAEIGEDKVFDFSLGNPSVPAPESVNKTLVKLITEKDPIMLHGYTSGPGDTSVRGAIADYLNKKYDVGTCAGDIYMTVGAAASLTVSLTALLHPDENVIALAPFFPEYRVFTERTGASLRVVQSSQPDFQIDFDALDAAVDEKTKAMIINSPNNPSGAVLTRKTLEKLADYFRKKEKEYGHEIFLISDEPYRELVYGNIEVPYLTNLYDDTLVCYSFSKSLSLPGERIGYILVSPHIKAKADVWRAVCGAGRALGFVCAPAMFQFMVKECLGLTSDISVYDKNRKLLYDALTSYGFEAVKPDGAFYLFLKSPIPDACEFCEAAKKYELLLVPSNDFGTPGYARISYCVSTDQIERSLPAFRALAKEYGLNG